MSNTIQIEEILFELLISISKCERDISIIKNQLNNIGDLYFKNLFKELSANNKRFTVKDINNYLKLNNYKASNKEMQLFILFYDKDHDLGLNYNEFLFFIKNKKNNNNNESSKNNNISTNNNHQIFSDLLIKEMILARTVLTYLEELQNTKNFKIHNIFHILKNVNGIITINSIYNFLNKYKKNISKE